MAASIKVDGLSRTIGQLSRAATCSRWVDLPVPWAPCRSTRRLWTNPARIAFVTAGSNR